MASVGELMGAVSFGFLTRCLYTKLLLLVTLFLCFVGGLVYAVGLNGWMLLAGERNGVCMNIIAVTLQYCFTSQVCDWIIPGKLQCSLSLIFWGDQ